jgi:hypothetical protein
MIETQLTLKMISSFNILYKFCPIENLLLVFIVIKFSAPKKFSESHQKRMYSILYYTVFKDLNLRCLINWLKFEWTLHMYYKYVK